MASSAVSLCTLCRRRKRRNRNGYNWTVPTRGRPGRDLKQIETKREKGSPRKGSSPFSYPSPETVTCGAYGAADEEKSNVRENAKIAAEARFSGRRACACRRDF